VAGDRPRGHGRELHGRDAALGLDARRLDRLAGFGGDRHRQILLALGDQLCRAVEHRGALVGWKPAGLEGSPCGLSGLVDEGSVSLRHPADHGAVVRGLHL
jgi:hypothetical protein